MNAAMPKSFMTDARRAELRSRGATDHNIYMFESLAAGRAGDEDTAWEWLKFAELAADALLFLKKRRGAQFIRDMELRTTKADAVYGSDWLSRE
ncbi:MAG: hypothetical protein LBQ20_07585 [Rhodanobacter sp.]|jgi:hypothetical protein|nr:hypothetical protein [Rhodanobacter sp.]